MCLNALKLIDGASRKDDKLVAWQQLEGQLEIIRDPKPSCQATNLYIFDCVQDENDTVQLEGPVELLVLSFRV